MARGFLLYLRYLGMEIWWDSNILVFVAISASQAEGREFESRFPLQEIQALIEFFGKCLFILLKMTAERTGETD
jgi:hypothetical protein